MNGNKLDTQDQPLPWEAEIRVEGGELSGIVDKCEAAILEHFPGEVFQRGGRIVRVISLETGGSQDGIDREPGALQIVGMGDKYLTELFGRSATFQKYDRTTKGYKRVDPPDKYAKYYLDRVGDWKLPTLAGIIEAPTLRADGTLLNSYGFDAETGLYLNESGPMVDIMPLPSEPDLLRKCAEKCLRELGKLLYEFPFVSEEDKAVAVAAILTSLVRKSIPTAPLFAFTSPTPGTGKSMLADVVAMIATGHPAAVMSQAQDRAEEKKRILALLIAGDPIAVIDNVERPIESDTLCSVLTQRSYTDRILGVSRNITLPTAVTFLATGNNLVFKGDITRRVLLCTMDAKMERPDERKFTRNLYDYIPRNRARLIMSGLSALMAYHRAGRPDMGLTPYSGFDEWSGWVRSTLVWAGMKDPYVTRGKIEAEDPDKDLHKRFLQAWFEAFGDRSLTLKEAISKCMESEEPQLKNLWEVFREIAPEGKDDVNPNILSRGFMHRHKDVMRDGLKLEKDPESPKNLARWRVVVVKQKD